MNSIRNIQVDLKTYYKLISEKAVEVTCLQDKVIRDEDFVGIYAVGFPVIDCWAFNPVVPEIRDVNTLMEITFEAMPIYKFKEGHEELMAEVSAKLGQPTIKAPTPVTPDHYRGNAIETIDVMEQVARNMEREGWSGEDIMNMGNVLKYCLRFTDKNGLEDLKKARNYLNRVIEGEWFE